MGGFDVVDVAAAKECQAGAGLIAEIKRENVWDWVERYPTRFTVLFMLAGAVLIAFYVI